MSEKKKSIAEKMLFILREEIAKIIRNDDALSNGLEVKKDNENTYESEFLFKDNSKLELKISKI